MLTRADAADRQTRSAPPSPCRLPKRFRRAQRDGRGSLASKQRPNARALSDKAVAPWRGADQNVAVSRTAPIRIFSATMIAGVDEVAGRGRLDPVHVVTPGILVDRAFCPAAAGGSV